MYAGQSRVEVEVGAELELVVDSGEIVVGEVLDTESNSLSETIHRMKNKKFHGCAKGNCKGA